MKEKHGERQRGTPKEINPREQDEDGGNDGVVQLWNYLDPEECRACINTWVIALELHLFV